MYAATGAKREMGAQILNGVPATTGTLAGDGPVYNEYSVTLFLCPFECV